MSAAAKNDFAAVASADAGSAARVVSKRAYTVGMRVSANEKAALEHAAGKDSISQYLRRTILGDEVVAT